MSAGMANMHMKGDSPEKPQKKKVTMHTRRGHRHNAHMKEAERATKESLSHIAEGNEEADSEKQME